MEYCNSCGRHKCTACENCCPVLIERKSLFAGLGKLREKSLIRRLFIIVTAVAVPNIGAAVRLSAPQWVQVTVFSGAILWLLWIIVNWHWIGGKDI